MAEQPPISEHHEYAVRSLEALRTKLLDLSGRNRLLNFSHREPSRSQIRVIDEIPERLFGDLVAEKRYIFRPLPDPSDAQIGWSPAQIAGEHGIVPSYDLPRPEGGSLPKKHTDDYVQTLLGPDAMKRALDGIRGTAAAFFQELGIHTLHACFGFLRWYEADSSDASCDAPLVLLPVTIERNLERGQYVYTLRATGHDPESNVTLRHRLRRDFGIELPEYEPEVGLGDYLAEVEALIRARRRWAVRRWLTVAIVRFDRVVMYQDLAEGTWGEDGGLTDHPVLEQLLVGSHSDTGGEHYADVPDLDEPSVAARVPWLVSDADASQTAAIMDALSGRNMVIQGPPGTGKSQTITNLIAAAMAANKRVLFVAQKPAAVDVVRDRLEHAGLGEFVLSLHSTSTPKAELHASIARRLAVQPTHGADTAWRTRVEDLRQQRDRLNEYLRAMNGRFGSLDRTLHEIFWEYDRVRDAARELGRGMAGVALPDVERLTPAAMRDQMDDLRAVEAAYVAMAKDAGRARHPWSDIVADSSASSESRRDAIVTATRSWAAALGDVIRELTAAHTDPATLSPAELDKFISALERVPQLDGVSAAVLERLWIDEDVRCLEAYVGRAKTRAKLQRMIATVTSDPHALLGEHRLVHLLEELTNRVEALGWSNVGLGGVPAACREDRERSRALARAAEPLARAASALGWSDLDPRACVRSLAAVCDVLANTSRDVLLGRNPGSVAEKPTGALDAVVAKASVLRATSAEMDRQFRGWRTLDPVEVRAQVTPLRSAGWLARLFSPSYRAATRRFGELTGRSASAAEMGDQLDQLALHLEQLRAFDRDERVAWLSRNGIDWTRDDLELLRRVDTWAAGIRARFAGLDPSVLARRRALIEAPIDVLDGLRAELVPSVLSTLRAWEQSPGGGDPREAADARIAAIAACEEAVAATSRLALSPDATVDALRHVLTAIENVARIDDELAADRAAGELLREHLSIVRERPELGEAALAARRELVRLLPPHLRARVHLPEGAEPGLRALRAAGARLRALRGQEGARREEASQLGIMMEFAESTGLPEAIASTAVRLERALAAAGSLGSWLSYASAWSHALSLRGPALLLRACEADGVAPTGLADDFERLVYRGLVDAARQRYPAIDGLDWSGERLEATRARFAALDRELLLEQQRYLRSHLASIAMPRGIGRGPKADWTEGPLVVHESQKQKRHLPIRLLMSRAANALATIKPCFMMSPLSVAQFLPPHSIEFDLLVIDEASQMRPEDACGAVIRAKQVVIVGDRKQLPPTSFFSADDPTDENVDEEPMESILDWVTATFRPIRDLRWHYRSRHESLIAFSNAHFYGDRLAVFPSPASASARLGVQFRYVANGSYKSSINRPEAEAVVAEALRLMDEAPDRSLGIVAMNVGQKDEIRELLDNAIMQRGDDRYRERWTGTLSPFFVRNLESVQGDERDRIVVSMTYGPEQPGGRLLQRFGPINGRYGHRRLNVLFTRAREQIVIVSSMKPTDVVDDPGKSEGIRALRAYLEYAASGARALGTPRPQGSAESPFEVSVAKFLRHNGFDVAHQIGVRGFSIDLAIRDPQTGGFLCGVECDGAAYHSSRSARDRDRLRQEVLEAMGWRLVRVWSTDWFRSRDAAQRTLLARIASSRGGARG
jgi:very-short-patch-repair endonuclease